MPIDDPLNVLITGASSGLGLEFARLFAADGHNLILIARNHDRLKEISAELTRQYQITSFILPRDLSHPAAPEDIWKELGGARNKVDVVVNNAGFGYWGAFNTLPIQDQLSMIRVNISALTEMTHLFLPQMLERKRGGILNVASVAGFLPGPMMATYYASKAYVVSFTEALANEYKGSGLRISAFCPGPTRTDFQQRAGLQNLRKNRPGIMDAAPATRIGYEGFKKGKTVVVPGIFNKIAVWGVRFVPRPLTLFLISRIQKKKRP